MFAMATRINGKAGHMSDIMLVCNQFKKVRRTVSPTDAVCKDFIVNENGTSTRVSGDTGNGFPSRSLSVSIASVWDSESTMTR